MKSLGLKPKERLRVGLRKWPILTLIAISPLLVNVASCPSKDPNAPDLRFKPPLYATDSRAGVITRSNETIGCRESKFDEFMCSPADAITQHIKELADLSWRCEKWRSAK